MINKTSTNSFVTTKWMAKLPDSSAPYHTLSPSSLNHLITVIHYTLLFHQHLNIPSIQLLFPTPEHSLLNAHGPVFDALVEHIFKTKAHLIDHINHDHDHNQQHSLKSSSKLTLDQLKLYFREHCSPPQRLSQFAQQLTHCVMSEPMRTLILPPDGRVTSSTTARVRTEARLSPAVRDSKGISYTWIRGTHTDGCASGRVFANGRVWSSQDLCNVADIVEQSITGDGSATTSAHTIGNSNGKRMLTTSHRVRLNTQVVTWLRDRYSVSTTREQHVRDEWKKEQERKEIEHREREKRMRSNLGRIGVDGEGCVTVAGQKVHVGQFGRGRRERRVVSYVDQLDLDAGVNDDAEGDDDEGDDDDDDEDDYDGGDTDDNEDEDEEEEENRDDGEEDEDEEEKGNRRRSKRLRRLEPRAEGRRRVVGEDVSSSRSARAERRRHLKALSV